MNCANINWWIVVVAATLYIVVARTLEGRDDDGNENRLCRKRCMAAENVFLQQCSQYGYTCIAGPHPGAKNPNRNVPTAVTNDDLLEMTKVLWTADKSNRVAVNVSWQGITKDGARNDLAPNPLFNQLPVEFETNPVYKKQIALFDMYNRDDRVPDPLTPKDWLAIDSFLDEVMKTDVMKRTHQFLASNGFVESDPALFQDRLWEIWYSQYVRSGALSSCGGEHVQVGETKRAEISGLHNWVRFALLEDAGHVNYLGYVRYADLGDGTYVLHNPFFWDTFYKPTGGFFVGTSPAYDMSLFTLCFYMRPDSLCRVRVGSPMNHYRILSIQTFTIEYQGHILVGSAYPNY